MKVIAEIGSNWKNGSDIDSSLIGAKSAGADIVKFQYFVNRDLYGVDGNRESLPPIADISYKCRALNIEFMCTAFSPMGYEVLNQYVERHKIASAEITALDILEKVNSFKKPVLLSTGGASIENIHDAVIALNDCPVTIMYCVTDYPARTVDFRHLENLKKLFGDHYTYGYSDHSTDVLNIPGMAEALGCVYLEKHVNFTDHTDTPDAPHSLSGREFAMMVKSLKGDLSLEETFIPCSWQRVKTEHGFYRPR